MIFKDDQESLCFKIRGRELGTSRTESLNSKVKQIFINV